MDRTDEIQNLERSIREDENALRSLQEREAVLLQHIEERGFRSATDRERLLSEEAEVSDRLHKNKKLLEAKQR